MDMDANNSVQIESYVFWLMAQVILLTLHTRISTYA